MKQHPFFFIAEVDEGRPPIKVKFEIPYFTVSGIQVTVEQCVWNLRIIWGIFWGTNVLTVLPTCVVAYNLKELFCLSLEFLFVQ